MDRPEWPSPCAIQQALDHLTDRDEAALPATGLGWLQGIPLRQGCRLASSGRTRDPRGGFL